MYKTEQEYFPSYLTSRQHVFLGVADGVGGWRDYGVDPSQFSSTLMKTCERLVKEGRFVPSNPVGVLTTSYYELLQNKVPLLGECSQCLVRVSHAHFSCFQRHIKVTWTLSVHDGILLFLTSVWKEDQLTHYFRSMPCTLLDNTVLPMQCKDCVCQWNSTFFMWFGFEYAV